jgi:hypothetical protein
VTSSALTIPPWSSKIQEVIQKKEIMLKPIIDSFGINNPAVDSILCSDGYFKNVLDDDIYTITMN